MERSHRVIPEIPGLSMGTYRAYVETLDGILDRFGTAQRLSFDASTGSRPDS